MPGPGEQHSTVQNPFEEAQGQGQAQPRISEFTAVEIATLSSRLEKQLGPEFLSSRQGPGGGKVHYLAADKCISLANEVFGFNGWSSSIKSIQVDFVDETTPGKISLGLSVIVRVQLKDGTFHEDIGYGHIENCKGKALAFEKAKKEGTTDALKRALRNFGNLLGNCIKDKDYVAKVTKIKPGPTKWDIDNLHRHHHYATNQKQEHQSVKREYPHPPYVKQENAAPERDYSANSLLGLEDEFGSDDFDVADFEASHEEHPNDDPTNKQATTTDSRNTTDPSRNMKPPYLPTSNIQQAQTNLPQSPKPRTPYTDHGRDKAKIEPDFNPAAQRTGSTTADGPAAIEAQQSKTWNAESSSSSDLEPAAMGFFTARAAPSLQSGPNASVKAPLFNPHLESPSIRKTAGIDHTKTKPVNREAIGGLQTPTSLPHNGAVEGGGGGGGGAFHSPRPNTNMATNTNMNMNILDPQMDKMRKIGLPGGGLGATGAAHSPLQNRGSYKPPLIKRPSVVDPSVLRDVTSVAVNANASANGGGGPGGGGGRDGTGGVGGGEAVKKQKLMG